MTNFVKLICLPSGRLQFNGKKFTAVGWGRTDIDKKSTPAVLREVVLTGNPVRECVKELNDANVFIDAKTILCAGNGEFRGASVGDSGGSFSIFVSLI